MPGTDRGNGGRKSDCTWTVLSAPWIWHLEEQRPLTLGCGRVARVRVYACARVSVQPGRSSTPACTHSSGVDRAQLPIV